MLKRLKRFLAQRSLKKSKDILKQTIDETIESSEKSIEEISKLLIDFKKHKYHNHDAFLNLCIFSSLVELDLTLLLEKIPLATRSQEKKLYARVIATIIIDYIESVNVLIGKECLQELKKNGMLEFIDEFKIINKDFANFRKLNDKQLRSIRNNTLAHKSKDALILKRELDQIDPDTIFQLGIEIKGFGDRFVNLSTKILYFIIDYMTYNTNKA